MNEALQALREAAQVPLPEPREGEDLSAELLEWARGLREALVAIPEERGEDVDPADRDSQDIERERLREEAPEDSAEVIDSPETGDDAALPEEQHLAKLQADIAAGAAGSVKLAARINTGGVWSTVEFGAAFSAFNAGPGAGATGDVVLLQQGDHGQAAFSPGSVALSGTAPIISSQAGTAGTAATALRSDTKPGLKLVGAPADGTAAGAETLEFTTSDGGLQVKLGKNYTVGSWDFPSLAVESSAARRGLIVKIPGGGALVVTTNGIELAVGNGLEIDSSAVKAKVDIDANNILTVSAAGLLVNALATITKRGLCPVLPNVATQYLNGVGAFATPPSGPALSDATPAGISTTAGAAGTGAAASRADHAHPCAITGASGWETVGGAAAGKVYAVYK
ncbi:MAG: hypothetical protein FD189_1116 [Elusimicrobia bacterium]|nr:MAG: hypothetical protein FD189_1116 [Elusimicrobiota bacterium]